MSVPDYRNETDVALMKRVGEGDFKAMNEIVVRWQRPLINFFYRSVNSVQTAEDLAQLTFLKLYRGAGTYKEKAKFSSWVFLVARSVLISNFRKESVRATEAVDPQELPAVVDDSNALAMRDLEHAFAVAVEELPEKHRTAILLLRQQELSYEEIAAAMGTSVQNVKTWIFRARRALREKLSDFWKK